MISVIEWNIGHEHFWRERDDFLEKHGATWHRVWSRPWNHIAKYYHILGINPVEILVISIYWNKPSRNTDHTNLLKYTQSKYWSHQFTEINPVKILVTPIYWNKPSRNTDHTNLLKYTQSKYWSRQFTKINPVKILVTSIY